MLTEFILTVLTPIHACVNETCKRYFIYNILSEDHYNAVLKNFLFRLHI